MFELLEKSVRDVDKIRNPMPGNNRSLAEDLPPGWVVRESRSQPGRICYLNLATGKRQFARPDFGPLISSGRSEDRGRHLSHLVQSGTSPALHRSPTSGAIVVVTPPGRNRRIPSPKSSIRGKTLTKLVATKEPQKRDRKTELASTAVNEQVSSREREGLASRAAFVGKTVSLPSTEKGQQSRSIGTRNASAVSNDLSVSEEEPRAAIVANRKKQKRRSELISEAPEEGKIEEIPLVTRFTTSDENSNEAIAQETSVTPGEIYAERVSLQSAFIGNGDPTAIMNFRRQLLLSSVRLDQSNVDLILGTCVRFNVGRDAKKQGMGIIREIRVQAESKTDQAKIALHRLYRTAELGVETMPSLVLEVDKVILINVENVAGVSKLAFDLKSRRYCDFSCFHIWFSRTKSMTEIAQAQAHLPRDFLHKMAPALFNDQVDKVTGVDTEQKKRQTVQEGRTAMKYPVPPIINRDVAAYDILNPMTWTAESVEWNC